jgi:hypothetical protein
MYVFLLSICQTTLRGHVHQTVFFFICQITSLKRASGTVVRRIIGNYDGFGEIILTLPAN